MNFGLGLGIPCTAVLRALGGTLRLIDEVGAAALAAYDFDPMSKDFTGPTASVRPGAGSPIDVFTRAEVIALVQTDTLHLVSYYDQSGSAYNLAQGTSGDEPEIFLDEWDYPFADCVSGDFVRSATFFGAKTNVTMDVFWQACSNPAGSPGPTSFHGSFDFKAGSAVNILSSWWQANKSPSLSTTGFSAFDWNDDRPRQHTFKWLNGVENVYEFGRSEASPNTVANPEYLRFTVGKNDFSNGNMRFYRAVFFSGNQDADVMAAVHKNNFPLMYTLALVPQFNIGDSNTACGFVNIGLAWPRKVYNTKAINNWVFGSAIGGKTLQNAIDRLPELEKLFDLFTFTSAKFVVHLATNDIEIDNLTGAQALAKQATLIAGLRLICSSRGITSDITSVTCLPRTGDANFNTSRGDYNTGIIANAGSIYGERIVNTTLNSKLQNQADATYFADTTHLNDTGQTELATMIAAAI